MTDAPVGPLSPGDILLIIDVQNDFLPGGAIPVEKGDEIIGPVNDYIALFKSAGLPIVAARDWHLDAHCSFIENGGPWPAHCMAETPGAEFPEALNIPEDAVIISKATTNNRDYYSAFSGTELDQLLELMMTKRVFVCGLATDNCILNSARDAQELKLPAYLLDDAIRRLNPPVMGEEFATEQDILAAGGQRVTIAQLK